MTMVANSLLTHDLIRFDGVNQEALYEVTAQAFEKVDLET